MNKLERLNAVLEHRDLESLWLARPNSFTWLTGGSNVVDSDAAVGVAAVGYDGDELRVLTDTIEAERIEAEELPDLDAPVVETFPWYERSLTDALVTRVDEEESAAADIDVPGFERLEPSTIRQPLTETDQERYRALGRETAAAVEAVCRELQPTDTEQDVATTLSVALTTRGIETPVVLVGGGRRAPQYRHYTPTNSTLGEYALVSVTARRDGLHASCTRTVAFDPPAWLEERHTATARVEATALAATKQAATTGARAGDIFAVIQQSYEALGYENEWQRHHQGGAAGFAGREWIATPGHEAAVEIPMAYAWNPTIQGAKSEETVLVTDDGFERLTDTGTWPTETVTVVDDDTESHLEFERGLEFERPAILDLSGR